MDFLPLKVGAETAIHLRLQALLQSSSRSLTWTHDVGQAMPEVVLDRRGEHQALTSVGFLLAAQPLIV